MAPNVDHGFAFEKLTEKAFQPLERDHRMYWERVLDSKAAEKIIGPAACDYRLRLPSPLPGAPFTFEIECKASIRYDSLGQCFRQMLRDGQVPKARLAEYSGACTLYFFHAVDNEEIEIWHGPVLHKPYYVPRAKPATGPITVIPASEYAKFALALVTHPQRFLDRVYKR